MQRIRRVGLVASFDFLESVRSRRAIALLVLYLAGACIGTSIFVRALSLVQETVFERLDIGPAESQAMADALVRSPELEEFLSEWIGDGEIASAVVATHPLALFYGWMSLFFVPLLAVLFSCDALASEIASGSVRFALVRTDRWSWAFGKLVSQATLMATGLVASAMAVWLIGWVLLVGFEPVRTSVEIASFGLRAWFMGLPYLAIGIAMSAVASSVGGARALSIVGLALVATLGGVFGSEWMARAVPWLSPLLERTVPNGYSLDLWYPHALERLPALLALGSLALAYFALGGVRFARRDL